MKVHANVHADFYIHRALSLPLTLLMFIASFEGSLLITIVYIHVGLSDYRKRSDSREKTFSRKERSVSKPRTQYRSRSISRERRERSSSLYSKNKKTKHKKKHKSKQD